MLPGDSGSCVITPNGHQKAQGKADQHLWLIMIPAVGIPTVTCSLLAHMFFVPITLTHTEKENRTCHTTTLSNTLGVPARRRDQIYLTR